MKVRPERNDFIFKQNNYFVKVRARALEVGRTSPKSTIRNRLVLVWRILIALACSLTEVLMATKTGAMDKKRRSGRKGPGRSERGFTRQAFDTALVVRALRDRVFRERLLADPTATYAEALNWQIPEGVEIRVIQETPATFCVVLPFLPMDLPVSSKTVVAVAKRELTHREPCWGLGDGLE